MNTRKLIVVLLSFVVPIGVFAASSTDKKIEEAAKASYNYRTVLEDNVKVKSHDGVVTLTGTVQEKDQKTLAEDTVSNLPGVTSVRNDIVIDPNYPEHSDSWIAIKVKTSLLTKGKVSGTSTKVSANDGIVTLTGTAENLAQKELTEVYAKEIKWVKSVNNEIVVVAKPAKETVGEKIDDASITSQIKLALINHESTSAIKTKVTTNDGIVVLSGVANSDAEKALVTKLAEDIRGVKSVTNDMTVKN